MSIWLPGTFSLVGEESADLKNLNEYYQASLKQTGLKYLDVPIWYNTAISENPPYENGLWHVVSKEGLGVGGKRGFDVLRSPKITWIRSIVVNSASGDLTVFRYDKGGKIRVYLWHVSKQYVVVLEERLGRTTPHYFLITAFHVDENYERTLKNNCRDRIR